MKVVFITSAYLVTTNPYTQRYFRMLTSQVSVFAPLGQSCAPGCEDSWTGMASVVADVAHGGGLLPFFSTPLAFWISHWDYYYFFFSVEFLRSRKCSRAWYNNILSYHNVNGISLVFLPIYFSLLSDLGTGFFHV